jgi:soluble lytic murein transglycosylase-like protein
MKRNYTLPLAITTTLFFLAILAVITLVGIAGSIVFSKKAQSEDGNTLYALIDYNTRQATFQKQPVRQWRGPDPSIVAMVDREADRTGLPRTVMHDHVRRESGYVAHARNPKSTAKGLLQVLHGSHEAIVGRRMSRAEHFRLMADPAYALRVGAAHMKACQQLVGNDARRLYACHYHGHGKFGGRIQMAAVHFQPDSSGWLAQGSVALPWAGQGGG